MMTRTRSISYPVLAGLAVGTLLLGGCASAAQNDPPAVPARLSQGAFRPDVIASGDELPPSEAGRMPERERAAQRVTMKKFKPVEASAKMLAGRPDDTGSASAVPGAIAAVGTPPVAGAFSERRASEALDRLAGVITIRQEKRGAVITLANDRLVDSGQSALTSSGQYSLRELAVALRDQDGRTILIQGYTDSRGTAAVNDALSLQRAEAVRDFLATQGVLAETMRAEGLGAKRPVASNGTADGRAQNRRIEIVIAP
jgi:outer membrane protein OmpA-like peptidoglycan-associated protein